MAESSSRIKKIYAAWLMAAALVVIKVNIGVVLTFGDYFPPDFNSSFLSGRRSYFFGSYQWAFYAHIISGPCSLFLGVALISERLRNRWPSLHRYLGRVQMVCVLLFVVPGGFVMAFRAETGAIAGTAFALLAIATGLTAALGWRTAVRRRFVEHRRWMWRCFLLLCSAVVLRLLTGLAIVTHTTGSWTYPTAAWCSLILPVTVYETVRRRRNALQR